MPFGAAFAVMMAKISLAMILQRFRITVVPNSIIDPRVSSRSRPNTAYRCNSALRIAALPKARCAERSTGWSIVPDIFGRSPPAQRSATTGSHYFPLPALARAFLMTSRIASSSSIQAGFNHRNFAPFTRRARSFTFSLEMSSRSES